MTSEFGDKGKTVGLLLRMTRPIWYKGFVVVLDSGFCVLKGIVELAKKGVYGAALIKKRRYWPKYIKGDAIIDHFRTKEVGTADAWPGTLDNTPFHIFCMKEPDYVMSLMSSYGTCEEIADGATQRDFQVNGIAVRKKFYYPEIIYNHFHYRHAVDDHNNKRHQPISIEQVWGTQWWPNRVFAFFIAITEVNCKMCYEHFLKSGALPMLTFRKLLAEALIFNNALLINDSLTPRRSSRRRTIEHRLDTMDQFKRWKNEKWMAAKTQFGQRKCVGCPRKIRTYCACSPGMALCQECYVDHIVEIENGRHGQD